MDKTIREMHEFFLNELLGRKADLIEELERLSAVEDYHRSAISGGNALGALRTSSSSSFSHSSAPSSLSSTTTAAQLGHELGHTVAAEEIASGTLAKAAFEALGVIGRPARVGEIARRMNANGCHINTESRASLNSVYNAMGRKPLHFENNGGEWSLLTWPASVTKGGQK